MKRTQNRLVSLPPARVVFRLTALLPLALVGFTGCEGCLDGTITVEVGGNADQTNLLCLATGGVNSYDCQCTCVAPDTTPVVDPKNLTICLPDAINECRGGVLATAGQRVTHCTENVAATIQAMVRVVTGQAEATCSCTEQGNARMVLPCNRACTSTPMPVDATTFANADLVPFTHLDGSGTDPVCAESALDPPPVAGIAASLFAPRSGCDLAGNVSLESADIDCPPDNPCTLAASGQAGFIGTPCPEGGCGVDFGFDLSVQDFTIGVNCDVLGFGDVCEDINLADVNVSGISLLAGGAIIDASGQGTFGVDNVDLGVRSTEDGEGNVFGATNPTPTQISVDWTNKTCSVTQTLPDIVVSHPEGSVTMQASISLNGTLFNQPPAADAGPDEQVECSADTGAEIVLDGSGSTDPDDDIMLYSWRVGIPFNGEVLSASDSPSVLVEQPLGEPALYSLRVFDSFGVMDLDTKSVEVVDTTPPVLGDVTLSRSCLWPPNHQYVRFALDSDVQLDVSDACDANPEVSISNVVSNQPDNGIGDGDTTNDVLFGPGGFCIRSERAGGTTRVYTVTLTATDGSNNSDSVDVTIEVPPSDSGCPHVQSDELLDDAAAAAACSFP